MTFYLAKILTNDSPPRVGYVTRIRARTGGVLGAILLLIGLAFYGVVFHLIANLLTTPAHAEQFSPCSINGQPVPCQHFLSSNPDQMKMREEWLRLQVPRNPNARRDDDQRRDESKDH